MVTVTLVCDDCRLGVWFTAEAAQLRVGFVKSCLIACESSIERSASIVEMLYGLSAFDHDYWAGWLWTHLVGPERSQ